MKKYSHLFFDCDGVILNSNKIKTDAFYKLALNFGELQAQKLVNHHLENGGISRYEKIKFFQKNILKNTNIKLYQELVDNYGAIVKEKLMKAEISKGVFKISDAIAKHSVCHPGLPSPHGESHAGSLFLEGFHNTKSDGFFL